MAGAGYKLFNTGDVLTAAQVNTYLQEQAVMRFASATARTTALSGVLAEGMVSYLDDTNVVQVYNGSAWVNVGEAGDITGVTAGTGISGGGTSGDVTITNSMATAINAKGDLIAGTANDTFDRLAVGNNGDSLVADSGTTTGLRWQPSQSAGKNLIINGGFDIWQRGTGSISIGASGDYTADRWQGYRSVSSTATVSRQTTSDTTNLPFIQYCARVQRNSGNTSTTNILFVNSSETVNSIPFAGKTVTFSFYARAGANFSAASSQLTVQLQTGTGTDQNALMTGYTGLVNAVNSTATLTTTWQRFTYTATLGTTITEIAPYFTFTPVGTAGANDYYEITGVQVEVGSVATSFARNAGTLQGELAACQRYYERWAVPTGNFAFPGFNNSTTNGYHSWKFKVTKRAVPTIAISANGDFGVRIPGGTNGAVSAFTTIGTTIDQSWLSTTSSGLTSGSGNFLVNVGNNSWIEASIEL